VIRSGRAERRVRRAPHGQGEVEGVRGSACGTPSVGWTASRRRHGTALGGDGRRTRRGSARSRARSRCTAPDRP
jgi:hypothetical protein